MAKSFSGIGAKPKTLLLAVAVILGSLGLTIFALVMAQSSTTYQLQTSFSNGNPTEYYVASGTQFSFGSVSNILLLAGFGLLLLASFVLARRVRSELREKSVTSSLIEFFCLSVLDLSVLFAVWQGNIFISASVVGSELFWFILLNVLVTIVTVSLLLRTPRKLTQFEAFQKIGFQIQRSATLTLKVLLAVTVIFLVIANLQFESAVFDNWANISLVGILFTVVILYVVVRLAGRIEKTVTIQDVNCQTVIEEQAKPDKLRNLNFGVIGGGLGVFAAGLVMYAVTLYVEDVYTPVLILCGMLGGLGFGLSTSGNSKQRGVIGCIFGVIALLFGLEMAYASPIAVGYKFSLTGALLPVYKWHEYSFIEFLFNQLGTVEGVFFAICGLFTAYLFVSMVSNKWTAKLSMIKHRKN